MPSLEGVGSDMFHMDGEVALLAVAVDRSLAVIPHAYRLADVVEACI